MDENPAFECVSYRNILTKDWKRLILLITLEIESKQITIFSFQKTVHKYYRNINLLFIYFLSECVIVSMILIYMQTNYVKTYK